MLRTLVIFIATTLWFSVPATAIELRDFFKFQCPEHFSGERSSFARTKNYKFLRSTEIVPEHSNGPRLIRAAIFEKIDPFLPGAMEQPWYVTVVWDIQPNYIRIKEFSERIDIDTSVPGAWEKEVFHNYFVIDDQGRLAFETITRSRQWIAKAQFLNGGEDLGRVLEFWKDRVKSIHTDWIFGDNLRLFNDAVRAGLTDQQAAFKTVSGKLAKKYGFSTIKKKIEISRVAGEPAQRVQAEFVRP